MCLLSPGHKPAVRPSVHWARCVSHIINGSVHIETSTAISTLHSASQPVARDNTRHHRDQHWIYLFIFAFFSSSFVESTKDNPVFCYQHNDYHRRCDRKRWQTHSIFFDCCSTVCHTSAVDWAEIKKKKIFQPCRFTDAYSNISSAIFPILRANIARAPNQLISNSNGGDGGDSINMKMIWFVSIGRLSHIFDLFMRSEHAQTKLIIQCLLIVSISINTTQIMFRDEQ